MLHFRLVLSKFESMLLMKALSEARQSGQLTAANRILSILAISDGQEFCDIAAILRVAQNLSASGFADI